MVLMPAPASRAGSRVCATHQISPPQFELCHTEFDKFQNYWWAAVRGAGARRRLTHSDTQTAADTCPIICHILFQVGPRASPLLFRPPPGLRPHHRVAFPRSQLTDSVFLPYTLLYCDMGCCQLLQGPSRTYSYMLCVYDIVSELSVIIVQLYMLPSSAYLIGVGISMRIMLVRVP